LTFYLELMQSLREAIERGEARPFADRMLARFAAGPD
jgi:queuine/archaeosine tRNA-ribosyltransferase